MRPRPFQLFKALVRVVCRALLQAVVTGLIITTGLMVTLAYLGVPLPNLQELMERFESVSKLANILS